MKVVEIGKYLGLDNGISADEVLKKAKGCYSDALIIGYDKDGALDVRSSSCLDHKDCLFLIELFKHKLLTGDYYE